MNIFIIKSWKKFKAEWVAKTQMSEFVLLLLSIEYGVMKVLSRAVLESDLPFSMTSLPEVNRINYKLRGRN